MISLTISFNFSILLLCTIYNNMKENKLIEAAVYYDNLFCNDRKIGYVFNIFKLPRWSMRHAAAIVIASAIIESIYNTQWLIPFIAIVLYSEIGYKMSMVSKLIGWCIRDEMVIHESSSNEVKINRNHREEIINDNKNRFVSESFIRKAEERMKDIIVSISIFTISYVLFNTF